jgi:hypothetical protein
VISSFGGGWTVSKGTTTISEPLSTGRWNEMSTPRFGWALVSAPFWRLRAHTREGRARLSDLLSKSMGASDRDRADVMVKCGILARLQGDHAEARTHLEQALGIFGRAGDRFKSARTLRDLGAVTWHQGDLPLARVSA